MGEQTGKKPKKHISVGLLAHVDAGKTTLSESILYQSGCLEKPGRVDKQDTFLDHYELERARGITIFSKQAVFSLGNVSVTLLDTPGHVDFSAEMERTLQVLDYAILIISGADGVQGHTMTLWKLLRRYRIPVFVFVNKMDQEVCDREALLQELKKRLDDRCIDFSTDHSSEAFLEELAMCEESLLEHYLKTGEVTRVEICRLIADRDVFPCYFGSALRQEGIEEFLQGLTEYTICPSYGEAFAAKVFKITRDEQGNRLTWLRVTGGSLKVKAQLSGQLEEEVWEEKINQIRIYSGAKYERVNEVSAGMICAVTGLTKTYPGEGLGVEPASDLPILEPVLTYQIQLPRGCDPKQMFLKLKVLEEEEPELHIRWDENLQEIQAQLMGEVQIEVLKVLIQERFDVSVDFGEGQIVYKETIADVVEGVGHFEPLRHYAEVHLLLEPGEIGSGMQYLTSCSEDTLDKNWQRLILTHLEEREHKGVLTGSALTDVKITLAAGKAHLKHTEGGDFRQATYRAVRQGLMQAKSVLLEPCYEFRLEVPSDLIGRAMSDVEKMKGSFASPELQGELSILTGTAPVSTMRNYHQEVVAYTRGKGRLFCAWKGYMPCHNQEEVVEMIGYDPEADLEHTPDSVFCYHGAGTIVSWYEAPAHMHLENMLLKAAQTEEEPEWSVGRTQRSVAYGTVEEEKELQEIFERTFGKGKKYKEEQQVRRKRYDTQERTNVRIYKPKERLPEYLLVDGYNVIFAWEELRELAKINIDSARGKLMDVMCNYQGFRKCSLILVFDAYRVEGHAEEVVKYHNIHVVYTKEAETADQYIERTAHEMGHRYQVTVATSDGLEQIIIRGQGCTMMSARELKEEIERINQEIRTEYVEQFPGSKNYLFDTLPKELLEQLDAIRLGQK